MRLLLIEDSRMDAAIVESMLAADPGAFECVTVDCLNAATQQMQTLRPDVILLDLFLGDSQGINTFLQLQDHSPGIPVVVLTSHDDEKAALQALQNGAQDYVLKGSFDKRALLRAIRYAVERQSLLSDLEDRARELEASEARFRRMIMSSPDGVVILGADSTIRFMNPAAEAIIGSSVDEHAGEPWPFPISDMRTVEIEFHREGGTGLVVESLGAPTVWEGERATLVTLRVITQHVQLREYLKDLAVTDENTGLYNRRGFNLLCEQHFRTAARYKRELAIMSIALGGTEAVAEQLGELEASNLVAAASKLIQRTFRSSDVIARVADAEFGVMLLETKRDGAARALERLVKIVSEYNDSSPRIPVALAVGVSLREAGSTMGMEELLALAQRARLEQEKRFAEE